MMSAAAFAPRTAIATDAAGARPSKADRSEITPLPPSPLYARSVTPRRTGVAAILAGALMFAGQGGELLFGSPSDFVDALFVALWAGGVVALGFTFAGLRLLLRGSRAGQIAALLGVAGSALLAAFAVQTMIEVARTGEVPENFVLFAFGFLLIFLAHVMVVLPLRRLPARGAWVMPLLALAGGLATPATTDPAGRVPSVHDLGLFVFEGAWVALGVVLLRADLGPHVGANDAGFR
jgi:hypothetical protein